jgi:hypothetical protein
MSEDLNEAIVAHVTATLGPIGEVLDTDRPVHILHIPPGGRRQVHTLVTCGVSARPLERVLQVAVLSEEDVAIERADANSSVAPHPLTELLIYLPPDWPFEANAPAGDAHGWPLHWLRRLAQRAVTTGEGPAENQPILHGNPPIPLGAGAAFSGFWPAPPTMEPERAFLEMSSPAGPVRFLALAPLYKDELQVLRTGGHSDLERRFARASLGALNVFVIDPRRKSAAGWRFWPF